MAAIGSKAMVRLLIDNGADVNARAGFYSNAPQAAASRGHETVVQQLIDHGADVNIPVGDYNALQTAAGKGHEAVARLLLAHGVTTDAQKFYWNALYIRQETAMKQCLGCSSTAGSTPILQICNIATCSGGAAFGGFKAIFRLLVDHRADANVRRDDKEMARLLKQYRNGDVV